MSLFSLPHPERENGHHTLKYIMLLILLALKCLIFHLYFSFYSYY